MVSNMIREIDASCRIHQALLIVLFATLLKAAFSHQHYMKFTPMKSINDNFPREGRLHNRWKRANDLVPELSDSSATSNTDTTEDIEEHFLNLAEEMQNQTLESGESTSFKCKVEGSSADAIQFTWYHGNSQIDPDEDFRFRIKQRAWGSRLLISDVFTPDSGTYRCEASNGYRRVHTSAYLKVSFSSVPFNPSDNVNLDALKGKCEVYAGFVCKEFLNAKFIYLEKFRNQEKMEQDISTALGILTNIKGISTKCQNFAKQAFCYFVFQPCKTNKKGLPSSDPTPVPLCREDCDLLKHDVCRDVFFQANSDEFLKEVQNSADCINLPPTTSANPHCTRIGLPNIIFPSHKCYNDSGGSYRGTLSVTASGENCQPWPTKMLYKHPELSGGHNFCRNPSGARDAPWCYVDQNKTKKEECQVPLCSFDQGGTPDLILILIPTVSIPLLLGCFVLIFCFACKKRKTKNVSSSKAFEAETKNISAKKVGVPELNSNVVHLTGELGDGKFGKVFRAQILSNLHYSPNEPVAVKTLTERATVTQVQDFQQEMEIFSELQHPNIAALKAVVVQPSLRCMIFEFTSSVDLHEYLVLHSPQADFAKPPSSASSHASTSIDHADFVRMGIQVASGMEYLSTNNFIHRDLAARNVLVCGNMELKICNLGVVRDSYLSSYYRSPQGGQMLPIRWMAPESLRSWQFSDKTAVWSFGVLFWEMFSYGLQPYCGYNNHEVLDMISLQQLLSCPDQCPAKVYSLMHECWASQPEQRPQFKDIHAKLVGWEGSITTRMTSQLAQGIHRQLTNVMREDGSGQNLQYGNRPGLTIDGMHNMPRTYVSGGTTSASSGHSGGFRPQYGETLVNQIPMLPMNRSNVLHQGVPSYSSGPHSRSSGSVASSDCNHHSPLRVNNLATHPELREPTSMPFPPPPPQAYANEHLQGKSYLSGINHPNDMIHSSGPYLPSQHTPRLYSNNHENSYQGNLEPRSDGQNPGSRMSRSNSGVRADGLMPLSVYQAQGRNSEYDRGHTGTDMLGNAKPVVAPKPPNYEDANDIHQDICDNPADIKLKENREQSKSPLLPEKEGLRRVALPHGTKGKATSYDSGLPCDEVDQDLDSEGTDSRRPLLTVKSAHPSVRPSKDSMSLVSPSASSSVSGYTQSTMETRLS